MDVVAAQSALKSDRFDDREIGAVLNVVQDSASTGSGRVTVVRVCQAADMEVERAKRALFLLLEAGELFAKYEPVHRVCGKPVGEVERKRRVVELKRASDEYGNLCENCQRYFEGDIDIAVQFWLSMGGPSGDRR